MMLTQTFRSTGRTERLILASIVAATQGQNVIFVAATDRAAVRACEKAAQTPGVRRIDRSTIYVGRGSVTFRSAQDRLYCWGDNPDRPVFIDHCAFADYRLRGPISTILGWFNNVEVSA